MHRFWDKEGKYRDGFLKDYQYWSLEVSFRQHTLGCFIIFCKRPIEKISELKDKELIELGLVMKKIEDALLKNPTFKPERFNYLQLGNALHNLHFHGIPRYKTKRDFAGKIWKDETFGHPPIWSDEEVNAELVLEIKKEIEKFLNHHIF
ncbi:MAG: hypothetical protein COX79_03465 [Candidatus Levybacteria bacterium CG_4_10_14_0_2_um_filter_36_16]|nr:MAG: hypothetical protein AUK12_01660 [Candidatus Levybacteria bacterium CG2_30_37_29]PIZ97100.1 MAG: hypothetical protein COX79_03465 [Candidatus Levybacteria bacterium CG_4_10_14_0_2_um_filter_36_16]